jgi:antitoxin ParD1/3/4
LRLCLVWMSRTPIHAPENPNKRSANLCAGPRLFVVDWGMNRPGASGRHTCSASRSREGDLQAGACKGATPGVKCALVMARVDKPCYDRISSSSGVLAMQTMNISLPDPLKDFVDGQITSGRYSSVSEYVRELIRQDEKRKAEERFETMLLEGLASPETALTRRDFADIRKEALSLLKARNKQG